MIGDGHLSFSNPMYGSSAAIASALRWSEPSNVHARRRIPEVMSNMPSLMLWQRCAKFSKDAVSSSTVTGMSRCACKYEMKLSGR